MIQAGRLRVGDPALSALRKALGLSARGEALHVNDLAVADGEDHEAVSLRLAGRPPGGGPDDLVADLREGGLDPHQLRAVLPPLELQDLTGLVRPSSTGRVLPPKVPVRDATPFAVLVDQRNERLDISLVEGLDRRSQVIDHSLMVEPLDPGNEGFSRRQVTWRRVRGGCWTALGSGGRPIV